jgi:uroporphyrinogen III methyltransferase/synthase
MKKYNLYIVGAGPGDPDLITLKGFKILKQADVIIYDYLVDKRVLEYANKTAELICADDLDKDKYSNGFSKRQEKINELLVKKVKEGKKVVRLKNGDPSIFSRLNEEVEFLNKHKVDYIIVPGVTAATAAGCYCGIPLTVRGLSSSVVITTGHEDKNKKDKFVDWQKIAQIDTIVLYMAVENLESIVENLIKYGKDKNTKIAVISNVSKINQKIVIGELKNIVEKVKKENITAPAVVIIGDVVEKEKKFNWFKKIKKVLYTGISEERFFENILYYHIPMISIKPLEDYTELDNWIKKIYSTHNLQLISAPPQLSTTYNPLPTTYIDWLVFTSRFGVYYFFDRLLKLGYDSRKLNGIKIAAIGSSTANKLKEYGIIADLVPKKECSDGLVEEFKKLITKTHNPQPITHNLKPRTSILLIRSDIADKNLAKRLAELGYKVYSCVAYRNVIPDNLPDLDLSSLSLNGGIDEIYFSSPSTVRNFVSRYGKPYCKVRTIGKVTENEARRFKII